MGNYRLIARIMFSQTHLTVACNSIENPSGHVKEITSLLILTRFMDFTVAGLLMMLEQIGKAGGFVLH